MSAEFSMDDSVAFLSKEGYVIKGIVKGISKNLVTDSIFYKVLEEETQEVIMLNESELMFAEVGWAKPMYAVGLTVADANGTVGKITEITVTIEENSYSVMYTLDTDDLIEEDDIIQVKR